MLEFAECLTRAPWASGPGDIAELRRHGFDDRDIHDIVQVAAYFNYINRVADGLGVEPEDFMKPWEHGEQTMKDEG
jgi:alkylhydroperoxidase family enzyme